MMTATLAMILFSFVSGAQPAQVLVVAGKRNVEQSSKRSERAMSSSQLTSLIRENVLPKLPAGVRLIRVEADEGFSVPKGPIRVQTHFEVPSESGLIYAEAEVSADNFSTRIPVKLIVGMLNRQGGLAPIIKRGADVLIVVRTGNVLVQSLGVAQENGGLDQSIGVIPNASGKVIRGRVKDGRTVEVSL